MLSCDVLCHCGDWSKYGEIIDVVRLSNWFRKLLKEEICKHVVVIAGNHDFEPERNYYGTKGEFESVQDVHYLHDSSAELLGYKFYGAPWQPSFGNWAFNVPRRSQELKDKWAKIPEDTEVLLTHGPGHGILDLDRRLEPAGCELLKTKLESLTQLKIHAFGHLHYQGGQILNISGTKFINAACVGEDYNIQNNGVSISLPDKK